jgi:hypothetical protein
MLIVYDNCEVEDVEPKAIDYITLDREMLEDTLQNQED